MMELNAGIARVKNRQGEVFGAAFLVSRDRLLTCAHVVCAALGAPYGSDQPVGEVWVDFPGLPPLRDLRARVEAYRFDEEMDYAVLSPQGHLPGGAQPPRLLTVGMAGMAGHDFLAFGFPEGFDQGVSALGEVVHTDSRGWMQIEAVKAVGQFVQRGFSGGPVFDRDLGVVTGMIAAVGANAPGLAFMIPLECIAAVWPDLHRRAYGLMQSGWQVETPGELKLHAARVDPPLRHPFYTFSHTKGWHAQVEKQARDIAGIASAFDGLRPLVQALKSLDCTQNYEAIRRDILRLDENRAHTRSISYLIAQYERRLNTTAAQIRRARYTPTDEEEELLALDSLRHNLGNFKRVAQHPEFGRCFLVIGEMGAGKTHFGGAHLVEAAASKISAEKINAGLPEASLALPLRAIPGAASFEDLLLANLRAASGIHWPDLAAYDAFAQACEQAHAQMRNQARLFVVIDDLGRWELLLPGFTRQMIAAARANTQLHSLYWLVSIPNAAYAGVVERALDTPDFWDTYADPLPKQQDAAGSSWALADYEGPARNYIGHWLALDDLNRSTRTGLEIIRAGLEQDEALPALEALEASGESAALDLLSNPLIAWTLTDLAGRLPVESAINLNFIGFIEAFWQVQLERLLGSEHNRRPGLEPLRPDELLAFARRAAHLLAEGGNLLQERATLLAAVKGMARGEFDFADSRRIEQALDLLSRSMILEEHRAGTSLLQTPETRIELRFSGFWALLLAQELAEQAAELPPAEFEARFLRVAEHLRAPALEFFLLLLDQKGQHALALSYCDHVLGSQRLPKAAVWAAGAKAGEDMQKGLVGRVRRAARDPLGGPALVALLYFLCELPAPLLSVPERFALMQPLYGQIQPGGYAAYFVYVVERLFERLESPDELMQAIAHLSGCEPVGRTADLADLTLDTLLELQGSEPEDLARWMLDYLFLVVNEYRDRAAIPGQEHGWRRYLYREYLLQSLMQWLVRRVRHSAYSLLTQVHWYDERRLRGNPVLVRHKEQEANIALGGLYRFDARPKFIDLVRGLCESERPIDRSNAFFIMLHSAAAEIGEDEERATPELDRRFEPLLEKLYHDPALERIIRVPAYQKVFRKNVRGLR